MAGANLLFPEVGASPRDGQADTGQGRGQGIDRCRTLHREMDWEPDGASNCFRAIDESRKLRQGVL
jgi:biotin synthase